MNRTTMLKVTSIINIVLGALVAVVGIIVAIAGGFLAGEMFAQMPGIQRAGTSALMVIFLLAAALYIAAGICGLKASRTACIVFGVIMTAYAVISLLHNASAPSILLAVLEILYVVGAIRSR